MVVILIRFAIHIQVKFNIMKIFVETTVTKKVLSEVKCDSCNKDITDNLNFCKTSYSILFQENDKYPGGGIHNEEQDLCEDCFEDLKTKIKELFNEKPNK